MPVSPVSPVSRRRLTALLAIVLGSLLLAGCGRDQPASTLLGAQTFAVGEREAMPPIAGPTLDGSPLDLTDLRGRVVVLNAWASWCVPCRTEIPAFVELAGAYDPADVAVVGLNVEDGDDAARAFVDDLGVDYPSIVDGDGRLLPTIPGVPPSALPSTVVLDRDGRIAARIVGETDIVQLTDVVTGLVAESGSETVSTPSPAG